MHDIGEVVPEIFGVGRVEKRAQIDQRDTHPAADLMRYGVTATDMVEGLALHRD